MSKASFWQNLPKPFTVLAPLDGVTDVVFRQVVVRLGKPDVLFTEFTNTDGLASVGKERVLERFKFHPNEQPLVAQIWGTNPDHFYEAAMMVNKLGFAGIDINMGCPERTVVKTGACSALIKNQALTAELIEATKKGAGDLPVSVKTRIGFSEAIIEEWIGFLLEQDLAALTVHLRTVKEMSAVPAHWEEMPRIKRLRDTIAPQTVLIGNGDIQSLSEVQEKFATYGCDGFMIGRGIFHNPWVFNPEVNPGDKPVTERVSLYLDHIEEFERTWKNKNFALLKKFCKTYITGFSGAAELRETLMRTRNIQELKEGLTNYSPTGASGSPKSATEA